MFAQALDVFGGVDILVNNAGISYIGLLTDMTIDDWNHVISTNLTSVFSCCHEAVPHMVRRQSGRIINISSVWGRVGASCEAAYSASKGGVDSLTKALARELAPSHIPVNAIACGIRDTHGPLRLPLRNRRSRLAARHGSALSHRTDSDNRRRMAVAKRLTPSFPTLLHTM